MSGPPFKDRHQSLELFLPEKVPSLRVRECIAFPRLSWAQKDWNDSASAHMNYEKLSANLEHKVLSGSDWHTVSIRYSSNDNSKHMVSSKKALALGHWMLFHMATSFTNKSWGCHTCNQQFDSMVQPCSHGPRMFPWEKGSLQDQNTCPTRVWFASHSAIDQKTKHVFFF